PPRRTRRQRRVPPLQHVPRLGAEHRERGPARSHLAPRPLGHTLPSGARRSGLLALPAGRRPRARRVVLPDRLDARGLSNAVARRRCPSPRRRSRLNVARTTRPLPEIVLTTCPRDCYDACGIAVVKRDGAIVSVRGDPAHEVSRGKLCAKCSIGYNGAWRDPAARITTPMCRIGRKGEGRFEPVSWDEALDEIATRLRPLIDDGRADTILDAHYTGTFSAIAYHFPLRLCNRLGTTEVDPDSICNKAGHVALEYVYGTSLDGFDPSTAAAAACIVVWGANPAASAPHAYSQWLPEAPGAVIVVDPVRTATAAAADLHLQPFPGSDAALAFALLHVLRREGRFDRDFVAAHTVGSEELEPLLDACSPDWGEEVTGVPAAVIEEAAALYGVGPSLLWLGQGFQRQRTGGNAVRSCALLPALTGNIGKPGAGFLYLNGFG